MDSFLPRILIALVVVVFVGASAALVWEWTVESDARPARVRVADLPAETMLSWSEGGVATIAADDPVSAATAIGYAHGSERAWTAALWRQTALGRLGEWFGGGVLPLDRHARQLGLASRARAAYRALPEAQQRLLRAYTRGMNAALASQRVQQSDPFVLLEITLADWAPWHPLAVERLLAWTTTAPDRDPPASPAATPASLQSFQKADRLLRRWLHAHGHDRSLAWTASPDSVASEPSAPGTSSSSDPSKASLFQRHVTGASALPLFQEIVWSRDDTRVILGTIPGTLVVPAGQTSDGRAWAVLLGSRRTLTRTPVDTTEIARRYERLTLRSGTETIEPVLRLGTRLPFPAPADTTRRARVDTSAADSAFVDSLRRASNSPSGRGTLSRRSLLLRPAESDSLAADTLLRPPSPVDSTWALAWSGLEATTDLSAWLALADLAPPPTGGSEARSEADTLTAAGFQLFDGTGLVVSAAGQERVLGTPAVVERVPGGVLVGRSSWSRFQAEALRDRLKTEAAVRPGVWTASDSSLWAARALARYGDALSPLADGPPLVRDAVTYLRNWNYVYDRASIGATLFDAWMRAYRRDLGTLPTARDSAYFARHRLRRALLRAVDSLAARQGRDLRQWRWERVAPARRFFPVFSADSLIAQNVASVARTRFAPLDRPGRGHPSALSGGPTLVTPARMGPAPSAWEAWTNPARTTLTARRLHFDPARFLARPLSQGQRPSPVALPPPSTGQTVLVPASP